METAERAEWRLYGESVRGELRQPGDRFGRLVVLDAISVSLLGILYEAKDILSGERVLAHLFPKSLGRAMDLTAPLAELVQREREVAEQGVLKPREVVQHEGVVGVVLDPFPGGRSLTQHFDDLYPECGMPEEDVRQILRKVSRALQGMADMGIRHLLLTPENVLINHLGEVRVFGFGWMSLLARDSFDRFVSRAIVPFRDSEAPPGYSSVEAMSPELRDGQQVDERADIYSLGLLGYFLLTHRRPVASWTLPSKTAEGISEGWDYFISRCLDPMREQRYATWVGFQKDLDQIEHLAALARRSLLEGAVWRKLDQIPLPRGVRRRFSPQGQRYLRLVVLGLFGCFAVAVSSLSYVILLTEETVVDAEVLPVVAVHAGEAANLLLKVDPPDARVQILGPGGGVFQPVDGAVRVKAPFREFTVLVEAPLHLPERFRVRLDNTEQVRTVNLGIDWGHLRVVGPAGARMDVAHADGRTSFLDTIPEDGVWEDNRRLLAQTYDLIVQQEGYAPARFEGVELGRDWRELQVTLEPLPSTLKVVSQPEGAVVLLEGVEIGRTPLVYDAVEPLSEVTLSVTGENFRWSERLIRIEPGRENLVDFGMLEETTSTLFLTVRLRGQSPGTEESEDLHVELAGALHVGAAQVDQQVPSGRQLVSVTHPDYFPHREEVTLRDREAASLTIDLMPRPGKLRLLIPDRAYRVTVDGTESRPVQNIVAIPPEKPVEVVLAVRDFQPVRRIVRHAPNEIEEWQPQLQRLPGPTPGEKWNPPYLELPMVWIGSGEYTMGSPMAEQLRLPNEDPRTRVRIMNGFWAGATEVTQEAYRRIMNSNPSHFYGARLPVDSVTWEEAVEFAKRLTETERSGQRLPDGYVYRLPTEAEWEYLARAGTRTPFHFGESASRQNGNFQGVYPRDYSSAEIERSERYGTVDVASYPPNAWGLFDVHGNVREWVFDGYNDRHPGGLQTDFVRMEGRGRTYRGGGWEDSAHRARSSARDQLSPGARRNSVGFRVVLAPPLER